MTNSVSVENESKEKLTLVFESLDGSRHPVEFLRSNLPSLISFLQTKLNVGSVTPMSARSLFAGQTFVLEGIVPSWSEGQTRIEFWIRLPNDGNRGVTLPVSLNEEQRQSLVVALGGTT